MERFVLECSGEQRGVCCRVCLDGFTKSRVGGWDKVWVVLTWSVHDLVVQRTRLSPSIATRMTATVALIFNHKWDMSINASSTLLSYTAMVVNKPCQQQGDKQSVMILSAGFIL